MSNHKHILTDFKDLRKVIGEITKEQPAKSRYQQQAEKMKYRTEAEPKDDKDGEANKRKDHAGEEEIKKAYLALGKSAEGSVEFQRGLVQKQLVKMGYNTYSKQAFSDLFNVEVESNELDEALSGDVKKWFAKKGLSGIKVRTVSGKNPFMQVTKGSNDKIPNDIIKKAIILQYDKMPSGVRDANKISYGNFNDRMFSLSLDKMAKLVKEEVGLEEARQLKDPKKEVLVVKKNRVIVIDKKDQDKYLKQGWKFAEEVDLDEAPKYDLYHKDFSTAMQYAYKMVKKLHGITIDPKEIDDKVATGPRKPSSGKTNKYRLKGDKGAVQIQVYNKGGSKPYELNMYKEEVDLDESDLGLTYKKGKTVQVTHKTSGKELIIIDKPSVRKEYEKIGYYAEEVELDEGRMKELHGYIEQGKSAEWIAKKMKIDLKTIKSLMGEEVIPSRSKQVKEEHEHAKHSPFKLKTQQYPRAIAVETDGYGKRHATVDDIITACDSFGMIIDKELQVEQVQKQLGKKGFITYKKSELEDIFESRETERIILVLESELEEQSPIEYTKDQVQNALDEGHRIEFLKPNGQKTVGPVLKLNANTFNVKDKYTGKSFTYKYTKIEEASVKTFNEVSAQLEEGMDFWRVTVTKNINKLKKGRSVIVKARNSAEALTKGAKNMGDPKANMSGYMSAVKDKKEEVDEGREKGPRQLINPNKEVMVVKKNRVIVISKKDQDKYLKQGWSLAEEVNEGRMKDLSLNIAHVYKQMKKDSVMKPFADKFKADASKTYDIYKSLEKVLPDYVSGGKITALMKGVKEEDIDESANLGDKASKFKEWEQAAEASGDKEAYQKFFNKVLKKFSVSSPAELEGEKKKKFFDYIDKNWKADHEEEASMIPVYTIKNTKTGQLYATGKYPHRQSKLTQIRKAGGDHKYAAMHKNGKVIKDEKVDGRRTNFKEKMKKLGYLKSRF